MTTLYAVAFILPERVERLLDSLRGDYASEMTYLKIPHITLKYPFTPTAGFDVLAKAMHRVAETTSPFTMKLNSVHFFEESRTAYVAMETEEPIKAIRLDILRALNGMIEGVSERSDYSPHITIGTNISIAAFPTIKEHLSKQKVGLEIQVDSLSIFSNGGDGKWRAEAVFKLSG